MRPWSTAFRIPTDGGTAWLKATGPGTAHEARITEHSGSIWVAATGTGNLYHAGRLYRIDPATTGLAP